MFIAGQIPLVPGTMQLVSGGAAIQSRLSLRHVCSVLEAMCPGRGLRDVLLCVCYVTHPDVIPQARKQWEELGSEEQVSAGCQCVADTDLLKLGGGEPSDDQRIEDEMLLNEEKVVKIAPLYSFLF